MTQDVASYYLVEYTSTTGLTSRKVIYRDFHKIEELLHGTINQVNIQKVDCADFNKQSVSYDEFKNGQQGSNKVPTSDLKEKDEESYREHKTDSLRYLKSDFTSLPHYPSPGKSKHHKEIAKELKKDYGAVTHDSVWLDEMTPSKKGKL